MTEKNTSKQQVKPQKKPNEVSPIKVEDHVRIFDPNTKQVYVEKRA